MRHRPVPSVRTKVARRMTSGLASLALAAGLFAAVSTAPAQAANPVTPGSFTGYGFDQCVAPTQAAMDAWLESSPFLAVGIYVSGDSRACREQPNLTPQWVTTQQAKGWKLLPIALGPQASCHPSFPRHEGDPVIDPTPGSNGNYEAARKLARAEAAKNVKDAAALGIRKGSTIWYDLEHFDITNTHCRESALAFMSAWNNKVTKLGYATGMYGGASSSLRMFDDARVERPGKFVLPKYIWIARWDGKANTDADGYLREDGWLPGRRMKQYKGDHVEKHGGVAINIDSNFLDLGKGSRTSSNKRCGVKNRTNVSAYGLITKKQKKTQTSKRVKAVQCLLREHGYTKVKVNGKYDLKTRLAVRKYRKSQGLPVVSNVTRTTWVRLLSTGRAPVAKVGSYGKHVHRLQQSLKAAGIRKELSTGLFDDATRKQVRKYQKKMKLPVNGVANTATWALIQQGRA